MNATINESMDTLSITQMSLASDLEEDRIEEQPSQTTNTPSCFPRTGSVTKGKMEIISKLVIVKRKEVSYHIIIAEGRASFIKLIISCSASAEKPVHVLIQA